VELKNKIPAIGIMSGTSLDGVDLAACQFWNENGQWQFEIVNGKTIKYSTEIYNKLANSHQYNGYKLSLLNAEYGRYLGKLTKEFIETTWFTPQFIASHGYTVFHEPHNRLTLQIGSGAHLAAEAGFPVICDFRATDVALGGNGAPLVPIGDELLFAQYAACLNLGGFSNISYPENGIRIAFDICPVNIVLNALMHKLGKEFDHLGNQGRLGNVDLQLLESLNKLDFYRMNPPKSLGREFVAQNIQSLFGENTDTQTLLTTFYQHISHQIGNTLSALPTGDVLVTGGGTYNEFLMELIQQKCTQKIIVPNQQLIDLKEAVIFAFLGMLRWQNQTNCLKSVTGAIRDNVGGAVYWA
jgi:anhydro-N-acetylmuramic acid kinase